MRPTTPKTEKGYIYSKIDWGNPSPNHIQMVRQRHSNKGIYSKAGLPEIESDGGDWETV